MKNQRIQELAQQAGFNLIQHGDHVIYDISTKENMSEFARLMVQECLADLEEVKVADYAHDEYDKGYDDGLTQAQETIKERFGVKR